MNLNKPGVIEALSFVIAYGTVLTVGMFLVLESFCKDWKSKRKPRTDHIYGYVRNTRARINANNGDCEFVLWKAGQAGHSEDFWHKFGDGHEKSFVKD